MFEALSSEAGSQMKAREEEEIVISKRGPSKSKASEHTVDEAGQEMRSAKWLSQQMWPCSQLQLGFLFPAGSAYSLTNVDQSETPP